MKNIRDLLFVINKLLEYRKKAPGVYDHAFDGVIGYLLEILQAEGDKLEIEDEH